MGDLDLSTMHSADQGDAPIARHGHRAVLLIAFHFPPIRGSSGWQRSLRFAQYLPRFGWRPIVLTVDPRAYESRGDGAGDLPDELEVHRAFGLNTSRHLSIRGRYPASIALPDRWATWRYRAVPTALRLIRERGVKAIWSTFPIATAHRIGMEVATRSGLPWIAEFRDPMWQGDYPPEPAMNAAWKKLERDVFDRAQSVVVTTPGAATTYADRFPAFGESRLRIIENGYDEETFRRVEVRLGGPVERVPPVGRPLTLLHSGIVYRSERDPTQLFSAVAALKARGALTADEFRIVFRACGDEAGYRRDLASLGIDDLVRIEPAVTYADALREMMTTDGLLILQASNCNAQVPAKLYEYLRAGRPILALTDPSGDTARALDAAQAGMVARLDDAGDIERALLQFITEVRSGTVRLPPAELVQRYSRQDQTGQFARLLDEVAQP